MFANLKDQRTEKGFTLIELSIVIVIIGLIVAGVVGGQSLVKQAKFRAIVGDFNKYNVAVNAFMLEYNSKPGDISNATDFWPGLTNNGNGNRNIICSDTDPEEIALVWQHLQLADLIANSYSGDRPGCNSSDVLAIGVDVPKGQLNNSRYGIRDEHKLYARSNVMYMTIFGYRINSTNNLDGVLLAKDARAIDAKVVLPPYIRSSLRFMI